MPGQVEQIAARIKELREIAGISPESLAKGIRLSTEAYRGYESGAVDIPIGVLYEVAGFFKIELTELLTGEAPRLSKYCLVRKDKGVAVERRTPYRYLSLAYNFIHKKAEPFLVTVEPSPRDGARGPVGGEVELNSASGPGVQLRARRPAQAGHRRNRARPGRGRLDLLRFERRSRHEGFGGRASPLPRDHFIGANDAAKIPEANRILFLRRLRRELPHRRAREFQLRLRRDGRARASETRRGRPRLVRREGGRGDLHLRPAQEDERQGRQLSSPRPG